MFGAQNTIFDRIVQKPTHELPSLYNEKRETATCRATTKLMRTMWNVLWSVKRDTAHNVAA